MKNFRKYLIETGINFSEHQDLTEIRSVVGNRVISNSIIWEYLNDFSHDRQLFFSSVYLLPPSIIVAFMEESGTLGNYLLESGFLVFSMSMGGDLIAVDMKDLRVFWFKKKFFLDGCDALIINNNEADPTRENLLEVAIFIGRFTEEFLIDIVNENYSSLFKFIS